MKWFVPALGGMICASSGAALAAAFGLLYLASDSFALASLAGAVIGSASGWCFFYRARSIGSAGPPKNSALAAEKAPMILAARGKPPN